MTDHETETVLYLFRKTDLRIRDNRGLAKAFSFGLPVTPVVCLDVEGEWNRRSDTTGLCAVGFLRRRFLLESVQDLEGNLRMWFGTTSETLGLSEGALAETLEVLLEQEAAIIRAGAVVRSGDHSGGGHSGDRGRAIIRAVVCVQELGTYEKAEEAYTQLVAKRFGKHLYVVEDDCLIDVAKMPFPDSQLPDRCPYTSFRKRVEKEASDHAASSHSRKKNPQEFLSAEEFRVHYCPSLCMEESRGCRSMSGLLFGVEGGEFLSSDQFLKKIEIPPTSSFNGPREENKRTVFRIHASLSSLLNSNPQLLNAPDSAYGVNPPPQSLVAETVKELLSPRPPPKAPLVPKESSSPFPGGETAALARLHYYFWTTDAVATYKETRNGSLGTTFSTKFSPYLGAGNISARTILSELAKYESRKKQNESTYWLLFELLWRDYFTSGLHNISRRGKAFAKPKSLDVKW